MTVPPPHCLDCRHYKDGSAPPKCAAFAERIPDIVWLEGDPHTRPIAGDNGIQFEPKEGAK